MMKNIDKKIILLFFFFFLVNYKKNTHKIYWLWKLAGGKPKEVKLRSLLTSG
jgi:hypothetical protein